MFVMNLANKRGRYGSPIRQITVRYTINWQSDRPYTEITTSRSHEQDLRTHATYLIFII